MKKILVIGAGAIGRGYVPWLFSDEFHIDFADKEEELLLKLSKCKQFDSYMTRGGDYIQKNICINEAYGIDSLTKDILNAYDVIITAVGPRNFLSLTEKLSSTKSPVICFENDRTLVSIMRLATKKENIYFGIPDVITSNASNPSKEHWSDLSLITEDGITYVENQISELGGNICYVDDAEITKQWAAKLYIHNTPHCIAAYLGSLCGVCYLHEAMSIDIINKIVTGVTSEMRDMTIRDSGLDPQFAKMYAEKELSRFSNQLLFDPILRVAREPYRKLSIDGRLIGAARKAFLTGLTPSNVLLGIMAAFQYQDKSDEDELISTMFSTLPREEFLSVIIGLPPTDIIYEALLNSWDTNMRILSEVTAHAR